MADLKNPRLIMEFLDLGANFSCSDPNCELDASVTIQMTGYPAKPWCTGHAHIEIAMFMVGL
jgi:hypothetical protein